MRFGRSRGLGRGLGGDLSLLTENRSIRRRAARLAGKGIWKTGKAGWRHRMRMFPIYTGATLMATGGILHEVPHGINSALALSALGAGAMWWWQHHLNHKGRLILRSARRFGTGNAAWLARRWKPISLWSFYTSGAAWLIAATLDGPFTIPLPGLLLIGTITGAIPWWWRRRIRPTVTIDETPSITVDERLADWDEYVSSTGGVAPGAELEGIAEILDPQDPEKVIGWSSYAAVSKGKKADRLVSAAEEIAGIWDMPVSDVSLEKVTSGSARRVKVTVYTDNPLRQRRIWPGTNLFNVETGIANIGVYGDGDPTLYRFYRRGSGPVHDLIAGTTDSGKSRLIDQLLGYERSTNFIASVVLDPQMGQSLPEWKDQVAIYARGMDQCRAALELLRIEMYDRNEELSDLEWVDEQNRTHSGIDHFDPLNPAIQKLGMPLISITAEECSRLTHDPFCLAILEEIVTMARKCGLKLRGVFQVPLLDQVVSQILRDGFKSGNVVVLRTANKFSGDVAFDGNIAADPSTLPREWPDGTTTAGLGYALGPKARSAPMRLWLVDDPYAAAHDGETTHLPLMEFKFQALCMALTGMTVEDAVRSVINGETVEAKVRPAVSKATVRERILAHLESHDTGLATSSTLAQVVDAPINTVSTTCRRMVQRGELQDFGYNMWARPGVIDPRRTPAEMAA